MKKSKHPELSEIKTLNSNAISFRHQYLRILFKREAGLAISYGRREEKFFISEITVVELRFGAENSDNPEKAHKAVDDFVNGLSIIPIIGSIKRYAKEKVVFVNGKTN